MLKGYKPNREEVLPSSLLYGKTLMDICNRVKLDIHYNGHITL
jgi:hypothetical protein